ncbi:sugar ABC transporter substrate-binding protein [Nocardioides halotolerans]|jgi:D-xylose transport system substrate-binding protein|uniref:sugar ABC transporter substrate-binding protein n=1 Tax=Nocardioides halotolerans TaxID=433660 RepID=UPI00042769E6|nr:substrate-binding domain-containing protein [Nocardioides halotolerans]
MSTPLHRAAALGVALLIGTAGLAACGDDSDSDGSGGGGGSKSDVTAACSLDNPPTSAASAPADSSGGGASASGKVGVILPDTTSSTRYELYDKPLLEQALGDAGITADVQNAQGDKNKFASIAQSMIGDGAQVLIIDSIDAASGAGVEQLADAAGVQVIDYDRVNLGGTAPYYVSFDNEDVGRLQAQTLVDCLKDQGVDKPKIIMMNGGTDVDNNAVLFQKGAHSVFDPLVESGDLEIAQETTVKGWKVENAAPAFTQALTASGSDIQGVLAANDDIANAVIGVLKNEGADGKVVVTGQDSSVEGLQNVVTGKQSMTIFKNVTLEAGAAAALAISLISGTDPADAGITLSPFEDPQAPDHQLQALLLPSEVITQANVQDVIDAGALTADDICAGIEDDCSELGIK